LIVIDRKISLILIDIYTAKVIPENV